MDWNGHLDSLIVWAEKNGYHVDIERGNDDCICPESKIIEINSSSSLKTQVIRLLHECGHALIFKNGSTFEFEDKKKYAERTVPYKVFTVIEEAEAWRRGRELAKRLQIPIDDEEWERNMVRALKRYINWASDLKEK